MVLLGSWGAVVAVGEGVAVEDVAVADAADAAAVVVGEEEVLWPRFEHHYYYEPVEAPKG